MTTYRSIHKWGRRREGDDLAGFGFDQLPAAFVDHPMVPATEQDQVVKVSAAAVYPVDYVVAVAPGRRPLATRPSAVAVASLERPLQRR